MAADAIAVLDAEGIERAHIVGASMGGVIAQIIGVMYPERVRSLDARVHRVPAPRVAPRAARRMGERRERAAAWPASWTTRMRWLIGPRLQRRFGVFVNVLARVLVQTKPHAFVAQVDAILARQRRAALRAAARSPRPTLVITGSQDTLTPLGDAEELAELITTSRLYVLRGAAHGLMAEAPNAFNDVVLKFLDEIDARRAAVARTTGVERTLTSTGAGGAR